jgi:hypothetical protein
MKISEQERQAIRRVVTAGESFGFGNMISHLATAWAKSLMEQWGMTETIARYTAYGLSGYPFKMQEDLMERGEWDESGQSYATARAAE